MHSYHTSDQINHCPNTPVVNTVRFIASCPAEMQPLRDHPSTCVRQGYFYKIGYVVYTHTYLEKYRNILIEHTGTKHEVHKNIQQNKKRYCHILCIVVFTAQQLFFNFYSSGIELANRFNPF